MPIVVKKQKGETKEDLLSRFRYLAVDEGIVEEVKDRKEHVKGARKRYEKKKAREKNRRQKGN